MLNGTIPETCEEYVVQRVQSLESELEAAKKEIASYDRALDRYKAIFTHIEKDLSVRPYGEHFRISLNYPCSGYDGEKEDFDWYVKTFGLEIPKKEEGVQNEA